MAKSPRRLERLQALFEKHGIRPSSRRGQNFLLDRNQVSYIARLGELAPEDVVLEVGPGTGFLTNEVAPAAGRVLCVEFDHKLAQVAAEELAQYSNVELIEADILAGKNSINPGVLERLQEILVEHGPTARLKSVSNLPYSAGTPFCMNLFSSDLPWTRCVFLLQHEVAERMTARPGTSAYGGLSITCALGGRVRIERKVPPPVFWPRPRVASGVVKVDLNPVEERLAIPWALLRRVTSAVFSSRRKRLRNSLKGLFGKDQVDGVIADAGLDADARAEALPPEVFLDLAKRLGELNPQGSSHIASS